MQRSRWARRLSAGGRRLALALVLHAAPTAAEAPPSANETPASRQERFRLLAVASAPSRAGQSEIAHCASAAQGLARALDDASLVAPERRSILIEPSRRAFDEALERLSRRTDDETAIFYFCGRAPGAGAELSGARTERERVQRALQRSGVRSIAIWDVLQAGDRDEPPRVDAHLSQRGQVAIVARTPRIDRFESAALGSTTFTFHLSQALRGLGDLDGDGRVTVLEAFRSAVEQVPFATLSGADEVSLTRVDDGGTDLRFSEDLSGVIRVTDADGHLLMRHAGTARAAWRLRLAPGKYLIELERDRERLATRVSLSGGTSLRVTRAQLEPVASATAGGREYPFESLRLEFLPSFKPEVPEEDRRRVGFGLGLLGSRVEQLHSFQASLAYNRTDEASRGVQLSGGLNLAQSDLRGVQIAGTVNYASGRLRGVQIGAGVNVSGESVRGVQLGVVSLAEQARVVQVGVVNSANDLRGVQTGLVNHAGAGHSVQVGLVNLGTGDLDGVQVGLVNLDTNDLDGVQVGLVNYADSADVQVGLISATRRGGLRLEAFASPIAPLGAALRFDANLTYSFVWAALDASAEGGSRERRNQWVGYGIGVKLNPSQRLRFAADLMAGASPSLNDVSSVNVLRLLADFQLTSYSSVFGGPSFAFLQHRDPDSHDRTPSLTPWSFELARSGRNQLLLIPSLTLGISLL